MTNQDAVACCAIAQNIANFAFRDEGRWDALRDLFHPQAAIAVSWYRGPIAGFIEASRAMAGPPEILTKHCFGLPRIQVRGSSALSEVDVAIKVRSKIGKLDVDVTSYARFLDRFEQCADGRWRIVDRTAIYEQDRIDPVQPSFLFGLLYRLARFDRYPAEYRHLAFGLERKGLQLADGIIVAHSPEEAALKSAAASWLNASANGRPS
jgi:hypothetical protein